MILMLKEQYRISLAASEVLLGQNHSLWDSMMLILAAREILYTGPLNSVSCTQIYLWSLCDARLMYARMIDLTGFYMLWPFNVAGLYR